MFFVNCPGKMPVPGASVAARAGRIAVRGRNGGHARINYAIQGARGIPY